MKPGDLVSVTVDNYDGGTGLLLEEGEGYRMCTVLMGGGKIEYYFVHELMPLEVDETSEEGVLHEDGRFG